jgi:hypothetical protein
MRSSGLFDWGHEKNYFCAAKILLKGLVGFIIFFAVNERRILAEEPMMETSIVLTVAAVISALCVLASLWIADEGGLT